MSAVQELFRETPAKSTTEIAPPAYVRGSIQPDERSAAKLVHGEQIRGLVEQLFFCSESKPVRHVAFAPAGESTGSATLCYEVASALAEEGRYDVAIVDAAPKLTPLQIQLNVPTLSRPENSWPIAPHLWLVPRESWLPDRSDLRVSDEHLSRLRDLTGEFDFSIVWCPPVSWLTASIVQACDGLVLVLRANRTRRLVAAQIKHQLCKARVPILGTVLMDRRFPVPEALYRNL